MSICKQNGDNGRSKTRIRTIYFSLNILSSHPVTKETQCVCPYLHLCTFRKCQTSKWGCNKNIFSLHAYAYIYYIYVYIYITRQGIFIWIWCVGNIIGLKIISAIMPNCVLLCFQNSTSLTSHLFVTVTNEKTVMYVMTVNK